MVARGPGVFEQVRVSRDGQSVAVVEPMAGGAWRIVIFDKHGNRLVESQPYPAIDGLAWSPDGREVWFSVATELHALGAGTQDRTLVRSMFALNLRDVAVDGRLLVYVRETGDLFVILPPRA